MKFPKTISVLLLFTLFGARLPAQEAAKPDPISIVKNCIAARGGESFIHSITTLYSNMKTEMEGREVNYITKELLPNKGSFKIVYKGRTVFQNWFDGKTAFETVNGKVKKAGFLQGKFDRKNIFNKLD
ncbi:hypothetical protein [Pedobacter suwonensis]|uniref:hypothetical protein n=1 Tax=Pedobacter suwonensis TaxID=332999 RepID=UPI0025D1D8BD|nr:hypothetical protein [uncultured Pedobacter sp.]